MHKCRVEANMLSIHYHKINTKDHILRLREDLKNVCNRYVRNYDAVNEIQVNTHDILKMMKEMDEQTTVGSHRMTGGILREHKTVSGTSSRYY